MHYQVNVKDKKMKGSILACFTVIILYLVFHFQCPVSNTPQPQPPQGRILVIILSETRAYNHTFDRFKRFVLDHLNADLALCVADPVPDRNNPFYLAAKYIWLFPDMSDWGDAFEFAYRTQYSQTGVNWKQIFQIRDQFLGGISQSGQKGSAGILLFMRWWLQQQLKHVNYQWYIVTRSDYYYLAPHPYVNDTDNIWIPEGEDWGGITDRHAVLPFTYVNSWLDFTDALMRDPSAVVTAMKGKIWNLESVLKWRLQVNGVFNRVKRFKQIMFTVRDRIRGLDGVQESGIKSYAYL